MSKIKDKIIKKILNEKKDESLNSTNTSNDVFNNNLVPPLFVNNKENKLTSENNEWNQTSSDYKKITDIKDINVTSSFFVPLKEENLIEGELNYKNQEVKYDKSLIDLQNNFKIPKAISFEIRILKLKSLFFMFFSFITLIIASLFIAFWFTNKKIIEYIPHPAITIILDIVALTVFLVNFVEYFSLRKEVELYIQRTIKGTLLIPNFIIKNYKKIHARNIVFNWVFITCYVFLGIIALIMFFISNQKITFFVQSWTVTVPDIKQDAITLFIILLIMFFIHMMNYVFFKKRKTNITSYYGYEIVNPTELEAYKKKVNRVCLIIFISFIFIIFFAIAIPILISRRKKKVVV